MPRYDNYNSLKEKFDHAIEHTVEFDLAWYIYIYIERERRLTNYLYLEISNCNM